MRCRQCGEQFISLLSMEVLCPECDRLNRERDEDLMRDVKLDEPREAWFD